MLRALVKLVLVVIVLVGIGGALLGWWGRGHERPTETPAVGTSGHVNTERARAVGAQVGEKTAEAANAAEAALGDAALTAKIKSKMALDDQVKARAIDVTTTNHVVTLSGTVSSSAERDRALRLARETSGVTEVVDHLSVRR